MENLQTVGSELQQVNSFPQKSLTPIIINEDYALVGEILSYDDETGKVTFKKVFDLAGTAKTFYAIALYQGRSGIPTSDEVVVGEHGIFNRVGIGNNNWTVGTAFQLNDSTNTTNPSFVFFCLPTL